MRYVYKPFRTRAPLYSLNGRQERPRPIVPVTIIGPGGTGYSRAVVDPASDDTVFHESVARLIGLDLTVAPIGEAAGVGQRPLIVRYGRVTLRMAQSREFREWQAIVGFTAVPLRHDLLGFAGFLQYFTATFHGDQEVVELTVYILASDRPWHRYQPEAAWIGGSP
jgi:hypothetical protein